MKDIPRIGFGTFGSDHVAAADVAVAVKTAIRVGYRHIDCASVYGNEKEIGQAIKECIEEGIVTREDLWITSKLWNDKHDPKDVRPSFMKSLNDLQLDYLDLYLIHWPLPNFHPPKCDVTSRSPNAKPFIIENFIATWRELEKLADEGLVRHIGVSNMTVRKMKAFLPLCRIRPYVNEMELHPSLQQPEFVEFIRKEGIIPVGYCPLGSPNRPERDKTPEDVVDMENPIVLEIAKKHNCHPAAVCLKWAAANGHVPIPFSTKEKNIKANLDAVMNDPLTKEEFEALKKADSHCRLIKGQVFLWKAAKDWTDIWDED